MSHVLSRRLCAVWFADLEGYVRLSSVDEGEALAVVGLLQDHARASIEQHGGEIVKFVGDGVLASFGSTEAAVRSALELAAGFRRATAERGAERLLRIGVHVGDVATSADGDVYGDGVNVASRIEGAAEPGHVVVSEDVWRQLRSRREFRFLPLGERGLKGVDEPLEIFGVELQDPATAAPAVRWRKRRSRTSFLDRGNRRYAFAALIFVALIAAAWWLAQSASNAELRGASIAVLPFQNLSGDPEQEYLVAGMHDALIGQLAQIGALRVISRTSAMHYSGSDKPIPQIAEELNVDQVVEATVTRVDDTVSVSVRLIQARPQERPVWSQSYERGMPDIFGLYGDVAMAIANEVDSGMMTDEEEDRLAEAHIVEPEIYREYLRGMFHLNSQDPARFQLGLRHLQQAVEMDPGNAAAHAGLALGYNLVGHATIPDAFDRGKVAAERALQLEPDLPEGHLALAEIELYRHFNWRRAGEALEHAIAITPSLARAHAHYAWYLSILGRDDEAIASMQRARELDPLDPVWAAWEGWIHLDAGAFAEAAADAAEGTVIDPNHPHAIYVLAAAYARAGRIEEAIATAERLRGGGFQWGLAHVYAMTGRRDEALALAQAVAANPNPLVNYGLAAIHGELGNVEEGLDWLERAHETGFSWMPWIHRWLAFDAFHGEPRFEQLLETIDLPTPSEIEALTAA